MEATPFASHEVGGHALDTLWIRGGYPRSFLASSIDTSAAWRETFNASEIGSSMDVSDTTASRYLDILAGTFMVRRLQPWFENVGKRQVKRPKI